MPKKTRRAVARAPQRSKKYWVAAVALLLGLLAVVALVRPRAAAKGRATQASADPDLEPAAGTGTAMVDLTRAAWEAGAAAPSASDDTRWRSRLEMARDNLLRMWQYPPESRPLAGKTDLIPPHFVPPTVRPLTKGSKAGEKGKVLVTQSQDRLFLGSGEQGMISVEATLDGVRIPFQITRADVLLAKTD